MEISRNLNCKQNKKEIDRLERKLDKLKLIANETHEINAQINQLEGLIKTQILKACLNCSDFIVSRFIIHIPGPLLIS
jgi:D-Tyr-tRNAtyr deacylase